MSEFKHSPLPWSAAIPADDNEAADCRFLAVTARDKRFHESTRTIFSIDTAATHPRNPEDPHEDVANLRLIVRAVNSHAQLVEALEAYQDQNNIGNDAKAELYKRAEAALTAAKGESN